MADNPAAPNLKLKGSVLALKQEQDMYARFDSSTSNFEPAQTTELKTNPDFILSILNYISLETGEKNRDKLKATVVKFLAKKCNAQLTPPEVKLVGVTIDMLFSNKLVKSRTWYRFLKKGAIQGILFLVKTITGA